MNQCARRNPALQGGLGAALIFDIMLQNLQCHPACGSNKETTAPHRAFVLSVKERPKPVQKRSGGLALQFADKLGKHNRGRSVEQKMDMVLLPIHFDNLAVDKLCGFAQTGEQKISPLWVSI